MLIRNDMAMATAMHPNLRRRSSLFYGQAPIPQRVRGLAAGPQGAIPFAPNAQWAAIYGVTLPSAPAPAAPPPPPPVIAPITASTPIAAPAVPLTTPQAVQQQITATQPVQQQAQAFDEFSTQGSFDLTGAQPAASTSSSTSPWLWLLIAGGVLLMMGNGEKRS